MAGTAIPSTVTVLIPCRNEENYISACLDSILSNDFPKDRLEIIVLDGMSSDRTRSLVLDYCKRHPFIKLIENGAKTVPAGLNRGIQEAAGDILVRMDAHSEYPPTYIRDCVALLESTGAGNAGGRFVAVPNGQGIWARPIARVTSHPFGVGNSAFRTSDKAGFVDTVPYGAFRRSIFAEVGDFDPRLTRNQDNELNARIRRAGYKIAFDPRIQIYYKNQANLSGLCHQAFFTGMWNVFTLWLLPHSFQWRRFVPAIFAIYLVLLPFSVFFPVLATAFCTAPFLAYWAIAVFVSMSHDSALAENVRTMVTFFVYHATYGLGTVFGGFNLVTGRWRRYLGRPLKS